MIDLPYLICFWFIFDLFLAVRFECRFIACWLDLLSLVSGVLLLVVGPLVSVWSSLPEPGLDHPSVIKTVLSCFQIIMQAPRIIYYMAA